MIINRRFVFAAALLLSAGSRPAFAQSGPAARATSSATASSWTVPRTPWGDPDLQGLWPSIDMQGTPYERPQQFGDRAALTQQELTERQAQTSRQAEADAETVVSTQRPRAAPASARRRIGASAAGRRRRRRSSSIRRTDAFRR